MSRLTVAMASRNSPGGDLPEHGGNVHLGRTTELAGGQTIAQVIAQQQFQRGPPDLVYLLRFAFDLHPLGRHRGARRHEPAIVADAHQAHQARSGRAAPFAETQGGNVDAQLPRGIEHRRSRRHFHFTLVDGELGHGVFDAADVLPETLSERPPRRSSERRSLEQRSLEQRKALFAESRNATEGVPYSLFVPKTIQAILANPTATQ